MTILTTNWSGVVNISLALLVVFLSQLLLCVITDTFRITLQILAYTDKMLKFVVHIMELVISQQLLIGPVIRPHLLHVHLTA